MLIQAQAQPKRYNVAKSEDERYQQKILLRAEIIVESANRLWSELHYLTCRSWCVLTAY